MPCDHKWKEATDGKITISVCTVCHQPDWDDLRKEISRQAHAVIMLMASEAIRSLETLRVIARPSDLH
jgi:hypothetical protein